MSAVNSLNEEQFFYKGIGFSVIHSYLPKQLKQPVWDRRMMPWFPKNIPTCAEPGFDAQFAIFAVSLSSFRYGNVCFQRAVLFVLFSASIWCEALAFPLMIYNICYGLHQEQLANLFFSFVPFVELVHLFALTFLPLVMVVSACR